MYAHNVPKRLARALAAPRFAAGVVVTLALLSAACSKDSASRINAPPLSSSSSNSQSAGARSAPSLGAASNFAVLSAAPGHGGAVTCTNSTIIGDVGSSGAQASVVQTGCTIMGAIIAPVSAQVLRDFNRAYDQYAAIACTGTLATAYTGVTVTLTPGVYCNAADVTFTSSTLILDAQGNPNAVWIFKIGTGGTGALTGTDFSVVMTGGGDPCNVYWWVAQAATMTTTTTATSGFQGTILAGAAITITGNAGTPTTTTFNGDALAKAAVTLTDVTVTGCEGGHGNGKAKCNQGVGNGPEGCDPGNSNQGDDNNSNDEKGGTPGDPGRKGGNSAEGQPAIKVGPIVVAQDDIGTCNNVWALDSFDKFYTITPNKDGTYNVQVNYKNGTFVTKAGFSPGACEGTGGNGPGNGNKVAAGITGRTHQEYNGTVKGTLSGNSCTPETCFDTTSILNTVFNSGWTWTILSDGGHWTWTGHYEAGSNGTWFDTSVNWPYNDRGDITGS